jgi:hypothetical protein
MRRVCAHQLRHVADDFERGIGQDEERDGKAVNKKTDGSLPIRRTNFAGEGGEDGSLPIVRGTSGAKARLRPAYGLSPFPSSNILGGVSIATSFLILEDIIHPTEWENIKNRF